jgi:hypothetical protein
MIDPRLKARIRLELCRCAGVGHFSTYEQFRSLIERQRPKGRFPWQPHFDAIAKEERSLGYPPPWRLA